MLRALYIVAYDVADDNRLKAVMDCVRQFATGGQKSAYECFLSEAEKAELLTKVSLLLDETEDRFFLLRLDSRAKVEALGIANPPLDPPFFYFG